MAQISTEEQLNLAMALSLEESKKVVSADEEMQLALAISLEEKEHNPVAGLTPEEELELALKMSEIEVSENPFNELTEAEQKKPPLQDEKQSLANKVLDEKQSALEALANQHGRTARQKRRAIRRSMQKYRNIIKAGLAIKAKPSDPYVGQLFEVNNPYFTIKVVPKKLHNINWKIATGYPDGSAVVNATFVWPHDPTIDITNGNFEKAESPYCFLITLWHLNSDFFIQRQIRSPYALAQYLKIIGIPPNPGKMYERDTIIPVAQHFRATIHVDIVDIVDGTEEINDVDDTEQFLIVQLSALRRHYISGLE